MENFRLENTEEISLLDLCRKLATENPCLVEHRKARKLLLDKFEAVSENFKNGKDDLEMLKVSLQSLEPYKTAGRNDLHLALSKLVEHLEKEDATALKDTLRILKIVW